MNRAERRTRARLQAKTAADLRQRSGRAGSAAEALAISHRLFELGKVKEALPGLQRAVAAYPDDTDLRGALAYALASTGQVGRGIEQYRALLNRQPDAVPVLTNLAILLLKIGKLDEARRHLERAVELAPRHANTAYVLAELLVRQKRNDEAYHQYRRAAQLFRRTIGPQPGIEHCHDLVKLATAQLWMGQVKAAVENFDLAVTLRPDHALALARRGLALGKLRRLPEAIASLKRAAAVEPGMAEVHRAIGDILLDTGATGRAQRHFEAAVRLDPKDQLAQYFLAAARRETPDAPPPAYVEQLFNEYARTFEHHLVEVLQYRAPELLCEAVLDLAQPPAAGWHVIDLGCGTGLCGSLIRGAARHLVGVDLSEGMLDKARAKSVYDDLQQGDVADVLGEYADTFDLALCADVMVYLGNLTGIFAAAARALKPGALFAFTTEVHEGEGFILDTTGRYRHSRPYVEREASAKGLSVAHFEQIVARYQSHQPVIEALYIVRRDVAMRDAATD